MIDPFSKVSIGDPVTFQAQTWNALMDAGRAAQRKSIDHADLTQTRSSAIIKVWNQTGSNLPRNSVLGLNGPIWSPCDASSLDAFLREINFVGITPDITRHKRRYCVTLDPCPIDGVCRAYFAGLCQVQVDLQDESHEYANIADATTGNMKSSRFGHARIIWAESDEGYGYGAGPAYGGCAYGYTTGMQWCIVMLGVTGSCIAVGKANGNISPRSGSTPGTGNVDLYRAVSGVEDGPLETIAVLNDSSNTMTSTHGIDSGTRVSVGWDADDQPWVAPLECS